MQNETDKWSKESKVDCTGLSEEAVTMATTKSNSQTQAELNHNGASSALCSCLDGATFIFCIFIILTTEW